MHAAHRIVRGIAARVVARRPATPAGIIRPQLAAFPQQLSVQVLPAALAQRSLVDECRKESPDAHVRRISPWLSAI